MPVERGSCPRFPTNGRGGAPGEPVEPELAAGLLHLVRQHQLPAQVIADNPLLPECVGGVGVQGQLRPKRLPERIRIRRRGIECRPAVVGHVSLHPTVGVRGADHVESGNRIESAALKAGHQARGNTYRAEHDRHRGCKVLAVSLLPREQKIGQRIGYPVLGQL